MSPSAATIAADSAGSSPGGIATLLISGDLPDGHQIYGMTQPEGAAVDDILVGQSGGDQYLPMGIKINPDGSLTFGTPTAVPDPDTNGPTFAGSYFDGTNVGWITVATMDGGLESRVYKFVIDPDTLVATQQDMHAFTNPTQFSWTPNVINNFANIVVGEQDDNAIQTSHLVKILHFDASGFGAVDEATLDTTGLTGFDFGFVMPISEVRYLSGSGRWYELQSDGTVDQQPIINVDLHDYYNETNLWGYGAVENLVFSSLTYPQQELLVQVGANGTVTTTDLNTILGGDIWAGWTFWVYEGTVYAGVTSEDALVGKVIQDPLGTPIIHTLIDDGNQVIPVGMTTRGEFITISSFGDHYAIFEPA